MILNIPIYLTISRIATIPFFILFFYLPFKWSHIVCNIIFIMAASTDWFDGFLARSLKQKTKFGEFLDPIADKMIIITALVLISENSHSLWIIVSSEFIIIREIVILALREWIAKIGKCSNMQVSIIGKIKTTSQMLALVVLIYTKDSYSMELGIITLNFATLLTFLSMLKYILKVRHIL